MPIVTVVVPVYNVEEYLEHCLDSICSQSLRDIEIICVNDGSEDGSLDILKKYAANDNRIRIISKANGGLSSARNIGIEAAEGEYIMFVDSDDAIELFACETVLDAFELGACDVVTFGAKCFPEDNCTPWLSSCLSPRDAFYGSFSMDILFKENSHPYVWRSAFSREFFRHANLRFREDVMFGEDQIFYFMAYPRARGVRFISSKLYKYRVARRDSLMTSSNLVYTNKIYDHLRIVDIVLRDWASQGWLRIHLEQMVGWSLEFVLLDIYQRGDSESEELLQSLGKTLAPYISDVDLLDVGRMEKGILRELVSGGKLKLSCLAVYGYYLEKRGIRACLSRFLTILKNN